MRESRLPVAHRSPVLTVPVFVGREAEIELVDRALDRVEEGRGAVLLIDGAPGSGKTRFLEHSGRRARSRGYRFVGAACTSDARFIPFGALFAGLLEGEGALLDRTVIRDLATRADAQYWVLEELQHQLERAAAEGPVVIGVDDLQWADGPTLYALRLLSERLVGEPIMWLLCMRTAPRGAEVGDATRAIAAAGATRMTLSGLDRAAMRELASSALDGATVPSELDRVLERTGGAPLFVLLVVRAMREAQVLSIRDGMVVLSVDPESLTLGALPTVREAVELQLARMSEAGREQVRLASALGQQFTVAQLARLGGSSAGHIRAGVQEVLDHRILGETTHGLVFQHDLVRDAVRASVPAAVFRALRREAADIVQDSGASLVEVATMLSEAAAGPDLPAVDVLRRAATTISRSTPAPAAAFLTKALELLPDGSDLRVRIAAELVPLHWLCGEIDRAVDLGETALHDIADAETEAHIRLALGKVGGVWGGREAARQCRIALSLSGLSTEVRAQLLATLASLQLGFDPDEARERVDEALRLTAGQPLSPARVAALWLSVPVAYLCRSDLQECLDRAREAGEAAAELFDEPELEMQTLPNAAAVCLVAFVSPGESLATVDAALALARHREHSLGLQAWSWPRICALIAGGRLEDAAAEATGLLEGAGYMSPYSIPGYFLHCARAVANLHIGTEAAVGQAAADIAALSEGDQLDGQPHASFAQHLIWAKLRLAERRRDADSVRVLLRNSDRRIAPTWYFPANPMNHLDEAEFVRLALAHGEREAATATVDVLERRAATNPSFPSARATARLARGLLDDDPGPVLEARASLAGQGRPLHQALAAESAAAMLRSGDPQRAAELFDEARQLYRACGARRDAIRIDGLMSTARLPASAPANSTDVAAGSNSLGVLAALTPSERRVVELVASGATNREAARALQLSPHTVSTHLRHAFDKLGVRSRVEMTRKIFS